MLQVGGELDFLEETVGAEHRGELGVEDLDGHPPAVPDVLGQVHRGHTALAELALKAVAVGQGCAQAFNGGQDALKYAVGGGDPPIGGRPDRRRVAFFGNRLFSRPARSPVPGLSDVNHAADGDPLARAPSYVKLLDPTIATVRGPVAILRWFRAFPSDVGMDRIGSHPA